MKSSIIIVIAVIIFAIICTQLIAERTDNRCGTNDDCKSDKLCANYSCECAANYEWVEASLTCQKVYCSADIDCTKWTIESVTNIRDFANVLSVTVRRDSAEDAVRSAVMMTTAHSMRFAISERVYANRTIEP